MVRQSSLFIAIQPAVKTVKALTPTPMREAMRRIRSRRAGSIMAALYR
jgi:hypothetical protein